MPVYIFTAGGDRRGASISTPPTAACASVMVSDISACTESRKFVLLRQLPLAASTQPKRTSKIQRGEYRRNMLHRYACYRGTRKGVALLSLHYYCMHLGNLWVARSSMCSRSSEDKLFQEPAAAAIKHTVTQATKLCGASFLSALPPPPSPPQHSSRSTWLSHIPLAH